MDFDRTGIAADYDAGRALPEATLELWREEISAVKPLLSSGGTPMVLDLGCGTGRFLPFLATIFGGTTVGIDPSIKMLQQARHPDADCTLVQGTAEAVPVRSAAVDVIFMSMMIHHIELPEASLRELTRILRIGGVVVMRNSTKETIEQTEVFDHFPEAKEIESHRLPSEDELTCRFTANGFEMLSSKTVPQVFAETYGEYFGKIKLRTLSCLQMLPDEIFEARLHGFHEACLEKWDEGPIVEAVTFMIFKKP